MTQDVNPAPASGKIAYCILLILCLSTTSAKAQDADSVSKSKSWGWLKKLNFRGYAQLRYNELLETNPELGCEQCDKSWGGDHGLFFRRIRLVLSGQIHKRVFIYIQPDFASLANGSGNVQIRDVYFDVGLDSKNAFRIRVGQSKIPYGFENLQSSQNRLPLDRNDALNSAFVNERDIGVFAYWAPPAIRERFASLVRSGLKGSGDYGVVGLGVFNGQPANRADLDGKPMVVARVSWPLQLNDQIIEPGIQAYTGTSEVRSVSEDVTGINPEFQYKDQRIAASLIVYPKPFGLNGEYNIGTGPEYNPTTHSIEQRRLKGGYVIGSYRAELGKQVLTPFVRYQYYDGGKKHERDARSYTVRDLEIGAEWQPFKAFEIVAMYTISSRRYEDALRRSNLQDGSLLRLQFQVNL